MARYIDVYDFYCDVADPVLDDTIIFPQFECQISVDMDFNGGNPEATCTEVYVDGKSLRDGGDLSRLIRLKVMEAADEALSAGGPLWDAVAAREGVAFIGPAGSPDAYWARAL